MLHLFLFLLAIASLSQAANLVRLASAPVEIIGFWRLLFASLMMLPLALRQGNIFRDIQNLRGHGLATLLSGVFLFLHFWTFFYAAQNTRIANAMIIFASNPLFTALGAYLIFREKLTGKLVVAYILAALGLWQLFSHSLEFSATHFYGDLSALFSALFFSLYILTGKHARHKMPNSHFTFVIYAVVALLFGLTAQARDLDFFNYPRQTWGYILALAFFTTLLGHALFTYLLKYLNINFMSCGKLIEPALSAASAYFLFGEDLRPQTILAFILTATAVLFLVLPKLFNKRS